MRDKKFIRKIIKLNIILVISIIAFTFTYTYLLLSNSFKYNGEVIDNNYYDIKVSEVSIDYETTTRVDISENIHIDIDDFGRYKNGNSINIKLSNVGSIDAIIDSISVVNSGGSYNDLEYNLSLKRGDIINKMSNKMLNVFIKNNGEDSFVSFDIIINYKEVHY